MIEITKKENLPHRIMVKIRAVNAEDPCYVADELVELAEEVLQQIAAVEMVQYLQCSSQKEVFNDFLIQLFNSSGHDYNAGPLYRWAANMVKECSETRNSPRSVFFWEKSGNAEELCKKVHRLAELRNSVMHGFFVLPPEKNMEEAVHIKNMLNELAECHFFDLQADYHFWDARGFTGKWNITDLHDWHKLMADTPFGKWCEQIVSEQQEFFWTLSERVFGKGNENLVPDKLKEFIKLKNQGSFALFVHPADAAEAEVLYAAIGNWLKSLSDVVFLGYTLRSTGLSYSGNFLMQRLVQVLNSQNMTLTRAKKPEDHIKALRRELPDKKIVVLINDIHTALFSPLHVSKWMNFLFENNIMLVALGHHYEHFNSFFNAHIDFSQSVTIPSTEQAIAALRNYLRFKGPSHEQNDERRDAQQLETILIQVIQDLAKENKLCARRFADEHQYDIEYVHEIFALLHPWVKSSRELFEADTIDEFYGFPDVMTEVTPIYLALGRRDLKLEYQHKVISL